MDLPPTQSSITMVQLDVPPLMLFFFLFHILSLPYFIGIVIKYENMTYQDAIHSASIVLSLSSKASKYIKEIFDPPDVRLLLISLMLS